MIFGVAATKTAVVIAETKGMGDKFAITAIKPVPFEVRAGDNLAELLRCLSTIFDRRSRGASPTIALLKCSSGRFGSCLEAIKGEAITELAAFQKGLRVVKVAPQSLKKAAALALRLPPIQFSGWCRNFPPSLTFGLAKVRDSSLCFCVLSRSCMMA